MKQGKESRSPEEERALEKLYGSKHGTEEHRRNEQAFNDLRKGRLESEGRGAEWRYQKDVRHQFEYGEQKDASGEVTHQTARTKPGHHLHKSEDVINWRHTEAGEAADARARKMSKQTGDDAGHLISPEHGADPGDSRNIARQNFLQNQGGGTWHNQERQISHDVNQSGKRVGMSVEIQYNADKHGDRPFNRKVGTWQQDEKGNTVTGSKQSVEYGNFTTKEVRARQDGTFQKGTSAELRQEGYQQQREVREAQQSPDVGKQRAEWAELKRTRDKDKMRERVAGKEAAPEKQR